MLFAKTAILLEWKNLFVPKNTKSWFFWATITMIVINVVAYTVAIIMTCIRCTPVWKIWQPWVDGTCSEQKATDVATTFINLAMDVVILLLPQPIIWKLNMTRQRRIGVSLIFSMGLLCVSLFYHLLWPAAGFLVVGLFESWLISTIKVLSFVQLGGFTRTSCLIITETQPKGERSTLSGATVKRPSWWWSSQPLVFPGLLQTRHSWWVWSPPFGRGPAWVVAPEKTATVLAKPMAHLWCEPSVVGAAERESQLQQS